MPKTEGRMALMHYLLHVYLRPIIRAWLQNPLLTGFFHKIADPCLLVNGLAITLFSLNRSNYLWILTYGWPHLYSIHFWDELVLQLYNHTAGYTITKQRFGMIFIQAWDKAAMLVSIKAGFYHTDWNGSFQCSVTKSDPLWVFCT